jgi:hypothetical protein
MGPASALNRRGASDASNFLFGEFFTNQFAQYSLEHLFIYA